jgi:hypothetical protein
MIITDINDNKREAKSIKPDPSYPGFLRIEFTKRFDWYSIKEFLEKNPTLKHLVSKESTIPNDALGVVTSATPTTIKDTKQKWNENVYVGFTAWISRGKGEGQKRIVTENSHNTITVQKAWDVRPDPTSQYVLSYNIHDVPARGNTLPQVDQKELEKKSRELDKQLGTDLAKNTRSKKKKNKTHP